VILQEYLKEAESGDKRILLLNGEILSAVRRVPAADDARGNIHAGGTAVACEICDSDRKICARIRQKLLDDGLYFVGLDVVGDKLLEVNVVSPGGITYVNELYGLKIEEQVVDFLETRMPS